MAHFLRSYLSGPGIDLSWVVANSKQSAYVPYKDTGIQFSTVIEGQPATWNLWEKWVKGSKQTGDWATYTWSSRDPNPGVMQTMDYRITDKYKPPVGRDRIESQQLAAEWAKSPTLPVWILKLKPSNSAVSAAIASAAQTLVNDPRQTGVPAPASDASFGQPPPGHDPSIYDNKPKLSQEQQRAEILAQANMIDQMQQMGTPAPNYDPVVSTAPPAPAPSKLPLIIGGVVALGIAGFLWWKFRK